MNYALAKSVLCLCAGAASLVISEQLMKVAFAVTKDDPLVMTSAATVKLIKAQLLGHEILGRGVWLAVKRKEDLK